MFLFHIDIICMEYLNNWNEVSMTTQQLSLSLIKRGIIIHMASIIGYSYKSA